MTSKLTVLSLWHNLFATDCARDEFSFQAKVQPQIMSAKIDILVRN